MDPLERASQGYTQSKGGLNIQEFRNELMRLVPSYEDSIPDMSRTDLQELARDYLDGLFSDEDEPNVKELGQNDPVYNIPYGEIDPLERAAQGYDQYEGGMNTEKFRAELTRLVPSYEDSIPDMGRADLQDLARDYLDGLFLDEGESEVPLIEEKLKRTYLKEEQDAPIFYTPYEIMLNYLLPLNEQSLQEACRTSKQFTEICRDDHFWKLKIEHDFGSAHPEFRKTWKEQWIEKTMYPKPVIRQIIMEVPIVLTDNRSRDFTLTDEDIRIINENVKYWNTIIVSSSGIIKTFREFNENNRSIIVTFDTITAQIDRTNLINNGFITHNYDDIISIRDRADLSIDIPSAKFNIELPVYSFVLEINWYNYPDINTKFRMNKIQMNKLAKFLQEKFDTDKPVDMDQYEGHMEIFLGLNRSITYDEENNLITLINEIERKNPKSPLVIDGKFRKLKSTW